MNEKTMRLIPCLLVFSSLAALGATEEQINKKLPAQAGEKLVVDVDFGAIAVATNGDSVVTIDVWRKVSRKTTAEEESFLKENPVTIIREGDTVTIRSRGKS